MKTPTLTVAKFTLLLALVWTALSSFAQSAGKYEGPYWSFLDTAQLVEQGREITQAKYPDSDDATVDKKMLRIYHADGTAETQDETVTKVLTEKGKRGDRTLTLSFMLPYFTVEVVKLEVIRPDGEVIPVDVAANSKETIDDSQMAMNIYDPNSKILRVNIPKLEIDDMVHSVTRLTYQRPIIAGEFAEVNVFEAPGYIQHMSYDVQAPSDKPLKRIVLRDEIKGTVKYTTKQDDSGVTIHHWEVTDVPRMFDEPSMPPYDNVLQRLLVSTTPDWQFVSKWYWNLSKAHLDAITTDMKQKATELAADAKSDREKIHAIFNYVSKNIRYMGLTPEKDRPGFEPHDVNLTYGKKYGVCRDKAALLVSMLRAAGLNSFPVLINVGSKMDGAGPTPFFNHAIVSVDLGNREYLLMDPTDENTKELLPSMDRDQSFLVCRPEGENIKISPINPPEENMMTIRTTGTLSAAGVLNAKSDISFEGVNDNSYRDAFASMKPDDQWRFFERNLKRIMPDARLKSLKLTPENMLDVSKNVHAEIEFTASGMTASGNGKSMVSLPWVGKSMGIVNFILGGTGLEQRKYPLQTFVACGLKEEISIKTDPAFTGIVSLPTSTPLKDPTISYTEGFGFADGALTGTRELKLLTVEFTPQQYKDLKQTLKHIEHDKRKTPVLASTLPKSVEAAAALDITDPTVESDARVIESRKIIDITDAHTSTLNVKYSKAILNYAGKKREAEVKIDFNPACQEARVVRAVVTSKTGQKQEIASDEINVMDAGWNASAKRYTGGKILVANLPGVDIGSTIEVEFEIKTKNAPFISGMERFQLPDELDSKTVTLTAPANLNLSKRISGKPEGIKESVQKQSDKQVLEWNVQKVKGMPAERALPPDWLYASGVSYFAGDAAAYWSELNRTMLDRAAKSEKAAELAKQLTGQVKTKAEALQAIRDFVSKSIRHAGPNFTELPLSELSAADTTLSDGYGHSADRAILYYAMLKAAGLQPELVLASDLPPITAITTVTSAFPMPQSFESPLVKVTVDNQTYYLNDSDQYARLGTTPHDNSLAVILSSGAIETIHATKGCEDKVETAYTMTVSDNGKTQIGIARKYYGTDFNGKRRYFAELPPEERRRYFQEIVSAVSQGARPVGDLTTQFDTYPGVEQFTVEIDDYVVVDGKYLYFDLPFTPSLVPLDAGSRVLPYYIADRRQRSVRTEIQLPPGFNEVVIAPTGSELTSPCDSGFAKTITKTDAGKVIITHDFETRPAVIDPKDYAALLKVESTLGQKASRVFLLQSSAK